jgi:hypothetical protein
VGRNDPSIVCTYEYEKIKEKNHRLITHTKKSLSLLEPEMKNWPILGFPLSKNKCTMHGT